MKTLLLSCLIFISLVATAQNNVSFSASLKDSITQQPVAFASITNLRSKQTTLSDSKGIFIIKVNHNDMLSIAAAGYTYDTLRFTKDHLNQIHTVVLLHPISRTLPGVVINASRKFSAYQLDSMQRRKDFFGTISDHTQPVASLANSGAGLGINLDHFYKREKRKREMVAMFTQMEKEQYINYKFSPAEITKYATLTPDSLLLFMQRYRPDYNWLRSHHQDEDLLYYINDKLKLFLKKD
ncbi:MAG: hypothetical protein KGO81_14245 [Bacteroidota bacterium]|nr:hypothetical protein [Bacteroidota bacterium]